MRHKPESKIHLRAFLSLINYYLQNIASIIVPVISYQNEMLHFQWTSFAQKEFNTRNDNIGPDLPV